MKKFLLTFFVAAAMLYSRAQFYDVSSIPYYPFPYDSGIAIITPIDDIWSSSVDIGFEFVYFGEVYQRLFVGSNGIISFDSTNVSTTCTWALTGTPNPTLPTNTLYTNSIFFPYQDVDVSLGGTVKHEVYGSPPNRAFVVSFDSVPYYQSNDTASNCSSTTDYTAQIVLYETTNAIEIYIQDKDACTGWNSGLAILGLQNAAGTEATVVPGRNNTVWTATNEGWRFTPDSLPQWFQDLSRISGRVIADVDADCTFSGTDYPLRGKPVIFHNNGSNTETYIYTDMQGYYSKRVDTGSYTFTTSNIANQFYNANCPAGSFYTAVFSQPNDSSDNNLFADTIVDYCSGISVGLFARGENNFSALGTCDTGYVRLYGHNYGTMTDTVTLLLTLNDSTKILSSPVAYTALGNNQYAFSLGTMLPADVADFDVMVHIGCDSIGTQYCYSVEAQGLFPNVCHYNNRFEITCRTIGVPFDPNAMYVSSAKHSERGTTDYLRTEADDNVSYTSTFQNTGTAVAHNVQLKIPIPVKLNALSLNPTVSSAAYTWLVLHDTLIVDFTGIELPDSNTNEAGSHGYFKFQIQQNAGNQPGDMILTNTAIYFDNNPAVLTNTAIIEIQDPNAVTNLQIENLQATVLPNPATNRVEIISSVAAGISIYNLTGQLVLDKQQLAVKHNVDVSNWQRGIYFVLLTSASGNKTLKMVKGL